MQKRNTKDRIDQSDFGFCIASPIAYAPIELKQSKKPSPCQICDSAVLIFHHLLPPLTAAKKTLSTLRDLQLCDWGSPKTSISGDLHCRSSLAEWPKATEIKVRRSKGDMKIYFLPKIHFTNTENHKKNKLCAPSYSNQFSPKCNAPWKCSN